MAIITDSLGRRWDPRKHPRGRDGRFIHVLGFVHIFDALDSIPWGSGIVEKIDGQGRIFVRVGDKNKSSKVKTNTNHKSGDLVEVSHENLKDVKVTARLNLSSDEKKADKPLGWLQDRDGVSDKDQYRSQMKSFGKGLGFSDSEIDEVDDILDGNTEGKSAGKYITALFALDRAYESKSMSGDSKMSDEGQRDFIKTLDDLGVDDKFISDSPDGRTGLKPLVDEYNTKHGSGRTDKDTVPLIASREFLNGDGRFGIQIDRDGSTKNFRINNDAEKPQMEETDEWIPELDIPESIDIIDEEIKAELDSDDEEEFPAEKPAPVEKKDYTPKEGLLERVKAASSDKHLNAIGDDAVKAYGKNNLEKQDTLDVLSAIQKKHKNKKANHGKYAEWAGKLGLQPKKNEDNTPAPTPEAPQNTPEPTQDAPEAPESEADVTPEAEVETPPLDEPEPNSHSLYNAPEEMEAFTDEVEYVDGIKNNMQDEGKDPDPTDAYGEFKNNVTMAGEEYEASGDRNKYVADLVAAIEKLDADFDKGSNKDSEELHGYFDELSTGLDKSKKDFAPDADVDVPEDAPEPDATPEETAEVSPFTVLPEGERGQNGDGWITDNNGNPGPWGKYGAGGAFIKSKNENGEDVYLVVKSGGGTDSNGKWILPGGAKDELETPHQGIAREIQEELGVPSETLEKMKLKGDHVFKHPNADWQYVSSVSEVDEPFEVKGTDWETEDAKWFTEAELRDMQKSGELYDKVALDELLSISKSDNNDKRAEPDVEEISAADAVSLSKTDPDADVDADAPEAPESTDGPEEISGVWERVGNQQGSNPGGRFRDENGDEWYVKQPGDDHMAKTEVLTNEIYSMAGVNTPETKNVTLDGQPSVASKIIPDADAGHTRFKEFYSRLKSGNMNEKDRATLKNIQDGFVIDAWLDNYDVKGLEGWEDNILVDEDGNVTRIDGGGALDTSATGKNKNEYGDNYTFDRDSDVLDSFLNVGTHTDGLNRLYGGMSDDQIKEQIDALQEMDMDEIDRLIDSKGLDADRADYLKDKLRKRREDILNDWRAESDSDSETSTDTPEGVEVTEGADADAPEVPTDGAGSDESKDPFPKYHSLAQQGRKPFKSYPEGDYTYSVDHSDEDVMEISIHDKNGKELFSISISKDSPTSGSEMRDDDFVEESMGNFLDDYRKERGLDKFGLLEGQSEDKGTYLYATYPEGDYTYRVRKDFDGRYEIAITSPDNEEVAEFSISPDTSNLNDDEVYDLIDGYIGDYRYGKGLSGADEKVIHKKGTSYDPNAASTQSNNNAPDLDIPDEEFEKDVPVDDTFDFVYPALNGDESDETVLQGAENLDNMLMTMSGGEPDFMKKYQRAMQYKIAASKIKAKQESNDAADTPQTSEPATSAIPEVPAAPQPTTPVSYGTEPDSMQQAQVDDGNKYLRSTYPEGSYSYSIDSDGEKKYAVTIYDPSGDTAYEFSVDKEGEYAYNDDDLIGLIDSYIYTHRYNNDLDPQDAPIKSPTGVKYSPDSSASDEEELLQAPPAGDGIDSLSPEQLETYNSIMNKPDIASWIEKYPGWDVQLEVTFAQNKDDADFNASMLALSGEANPKITNLLEFMKDGFGPYRWWANGYEAKTQARLGDWAYKQFSETSDSLRLGKIVSFPSHSQPNFTIWRHSADGVPMYNKDGSPKLSRIHMNDMNKFGGLDNNGKPIPFSSDTYMNWEKPDQVNFNVNYPDAIQIGAAAKVAQNEAKSFKQQKETAAELAKSKEPIPIGGGYTISRKSLPSAPYAYTYVIRSPEGDNIGHIWYDHMEGPQGFASRLKEVLNKNNVLDTGSPPADIAPVMPQDTLSGQYALANAPTVSPMVSGPHFGDVVVKTDDPNAVELVVVGKYRDGAGAEVYDLRTPEGNTVTDYPKNLSVVRKVSIKTPEPDTDSPLYGTPPPQFPEFNDYVAYKDYYGVTPALNPLSDEWRDAVYEDLGKTHGLSAEDIDSNPQLSGLITKAKQGDLSSIAMMIQSGWISDVTERSALRHFTEQGANVSIDLRGWKSDRDKFKKSYAKWAAANGVNTHELAGMDVPEAFDFTRDEDSGIAYFDKIGVAQKKLIKKNNPDALEAIRDYTSSGHGSLNAMGWDPQVFTADSDQYKKFFDMKSAIDSLPPFEEDLTIIRGVSPSVFVKSDGTKADPYVSSSNLKDLMGDIVGTVQFNGGFSSGSPATTPGWMASSPTRLRMKIPKGVKGVYVSSITPSGTMHTGGPGSENELILEDGLHYYVHGYTKVNGIYVIDVEVVPPGFDPAAFAAAASGSAGVV